MVFPSPFGHITGKTNFNPRSPALPQNQVKPEPIPTDENEKKEPILDNTSQDELNAMMKPNVFNIPAHPPAPTPQFNTPPPIQHIEPTPQFNNYPQTIAPQMQFAHYPQPALIPLNPYEQYQASLIPQQPQRLEAIQQPQRLNPNRIVFV